MAEKASRRVKTLDSFIKWAAQFDDGQYLFRGVSKDTYEIEASAYRRLPSETDKNPDRLLRINQDLIEKARLLGHDQQNGQRLFDLELLAALRRSHLSDRLYSQRSGRALDGLPTKCHRGSKRQGRRCA